MTGTPDPYTQPLDRTGDPADMAAAAEAERRAENPTLVIQQAAEEARVRSWERRKKGMTPDRGILLLWTAGVFVLLLILILRLT